MGLLTDYLTKTIPANARNLWGDVKQLPSALAAVGTKDFWQTGMFDPAKVQQAMRSQGRITPQDANKMAAVGMDFVQPMGGLLGHIVYHGSPHKFSKFDMSKIGTGEGKQMFGHGLYFAESPKVAQTYADTLGNTVSLNGEEIAQGVAAYGKGKNLTPAQQDAARLFASNQGNVTKTLEDLDWMKQQMPVLAPGIEDSKKFISDMADQLRFNEANLYKVDIPDESIPRMLDWDKPLSEQPEGVRNALAKSKNKQVRAMLDYAQTPYSADIGGEQKTMGEAFRLLNLNLHGKSSADSAKASALLAKQGIPGIRYLDGMSRGTGQGSSNYVLFDDQIPRILEINGQPTGLKPWGPDEWKGLLR